MKLESQALTAPRKSAFPQTRWSLVMKANGEQTVSLGGHTVVVADALEELCRAYWSPLFTYVRRAGFTREDAEDITQEFIAWFVSKDHLSDADRDKGRLRSYLLAILRRFLADKRRYRKAKKRGGDHQILSLDAGMEEQAKLAIPADANSPDQQFDRKWAAAMMQRALSRLRQEYEEKGKSDLFELLSSFLQARPKDAAYRDCSATLGISVAAVKMNVMRMRKRFALLFREEVLATVGDENELEEEIHYLMSLFG